MFNKYTKQIIFIIILLALTVITLFAYKKTASFFGFAKTMKSVNQRPCGFRNAVCCANSPLVKYEDGTINSSKSYYCTEAQTRCWQKGLGSGSHDYRCVKLEDVCGTSHYSPCCHDNTCRNRTDLTCDKNSGFNYTNPWYRQRLAPKEPDNPQLSFGTCLSVNPQITVTPGGPECGRRGNPCCPVNQCDAEATTDICLFKDNKTKDSLVCEDRSKATLKIYYVNDEFTAEEYIYRELINNLTIDIDNNDRILRISAETNVVSQQETNFIISYDRVFMFACDYHSDSDYKFIKDQPDGLWGNDHLAFCDYKNVDTTKPITIAVKMYMTSPWNPVPNTWPFVEGSVYPYIKQEVKRTVKFMESPNSTIAPSPRLTLSPTPTPQPGGSCNPPCRVDFTCNAINKCVKK